MHWNKPLRYGVKNNLKFIRFHSYDDVIIWIRHLHSYVMRNNLNLFKTKIQLQRRCGLMFKKNVQIYGFEKNDLYEIFLKTSVFVRTIPTRKYQYTEIFNFWNSEICSKTNFNILNIFKSKIFIICCPTLIYLFAFKKYV